MRYFRPPADYNGAVSLSVVAVSQEASSGSTALSSPVALDFTLQPVSEEPTVDTSNVTLREYTSSSSDGSYTSDHGVDLSNISVSLSDTSSLDNVTVTLSAVDGSDVAISGFVLEGTPSVGSASIDASGLTLTVSGTPDGADLVADLTTLLGEITLRPPEDFSGDATITASVTAQESGAEPSTAVTSSYTASVTAVAEAAVVTASTVLASDALLEDADIELDLSATVQDSSETIASVRISGLTDIGGLGLVGSLVDGSGQFCWLSDGAGTTTLTLAQFQGDVYFRPPADYNGSVSLSVVAVSQEASSGSTALSSSVALNFTLQPVSEEASSEVENINLIEFTNSTVDDTRAEYLTLYDNNPSYERPSLSNISVSVGDATSVTGAAVTLSFASAEDGESLPGSFGVFLEDGVSLQASNGSVKVYAGILPDDGNPASLTELLPLNGHFSHDGNDFTIFADTTGVADTNAIDLITSELAKLFVRPPEDFSGDVTVSTGVRSREDGAEMSPSADDTFAVQVVARAEAAVVTASTVLASDALLEDADIELDLSATVQDSSETIASVRISGLTDIGGLGLVGSLVDGSGNSVGVSDGAGTTTLTLAEFQGDVYFRPPADYNGSVSLSVVAVSQEASSGSTALSSPVALNFTLKPVSEEPSVSTSNVTLREYTSSSSDGSYTSDHGVDLSNISVSLSDTSSLDNVTVTLSAVDGSDVAISGFVLEGTPSVGSASIDASGLTLTVSGTPDGADLVADLTTLLGEITLRPPEDFSGDATITRV